MGKNSFTSMSESLLGMGGQDNFRGDGSSSNRIIYSAVVRSVEDFAGFNRIKAEIVSIDENGVIKPGKDKDTPLDKLPICIPLGPEFLHIRPVVGECVLIIAENPTDLASVRYWIGPLITSQIKLPYQSYEDSQEIYNSASFAKKEVFNNPSRQNDEKVSSLLPQQTEIAIQGRNDANITFSPREIVIRTGSFEADTFKANTTHPCRIQLKQFDTSPLTTGVSVIDKLNQTTFKAFSQMNAESTNINIFSPEGKFRKFDNSNPETTTNPRLKDFGDLAQTLHPVAFGDELIVLLKLILTYLTNHIHTPQNPALPNAISEQLVPYLKGDKLQDLISNHIRVN